MFDHYNFVNVELMNSNVSTVNSKKCASKLFVHVFAKYQIWCTMWKFAVG